MYEGCSKTIAYCVVAQNPCGTWNKPKNTCIVLSNIYTVMCTCAHKSNWKTDNLPFEYMQSLTTVVRIVGKCCQEGGNMSLHKSSF